MGNATTLPKLPKCPFHKVLLLVHHYQTRWSWGCSKTPLSMIDYLTQSSISSKSLKHLHSKTGRANDLKLWDCVHHTPLTPYNTLCQVSGVRCQLSDASCQLSVQTCKNTGSVVTLLQRNLRKKLWIEGVFCEKKTRVLSQLEEKKLPCILAFYNYYM